MSEPDSDASSVTAPDYRRRTWYPALAVGTAMVSFITIKTGRDAIFFRESGLTELPLAYILIAAVAVPAAMIHLAALERWGARRTRTALFFLTTLALLAFVPALSAEVEGWVLTAFFAFVPTVFAADFAGAWLLAGDLLEGADEKTRGWAYSRIGAASMLGGVAGGLLARGLSAFFPPVALIVAGSLTLVLSGFVVARAHRRNRPEEVPVCGSAGEASQDGKYGRTGGGRSGSLLAMVLRQPYVQALARNQRVGGRGSPLHRL